MTVVTRVDALAIRQYVADPDGPVTRDLLGRARQVERAAKRQVGVDTGKLRASIKTRLVPGVSPEVYVGSDNSIARLHHEGTRPHIIAPHLREKLRFKVRGRVVYATVVRHPGTRANRYLTIPLERYARG